MYSIINIHPDRYPDTMNIDFQTAETAKSLVKINPKLLQNMFKFMLLVWYLNSK